MFILLNDIIYFIESKETIAVTPIDEFRGTSNCVRRHG